MPLTPRHAWALALAGCLSLFGCDDDPDPTPDAGTPADAGTQSDAGTKPWDGNYTVLEERGDFTQDPGVFSPCTYTMQPGPVAVACHDPSRFNLDSCNRASLATLPDDAIYRFQVRQEFTQPDGSLRWSTFFNGVQLRSDGGPDTISGAPFTSKVKSGQDLFLTRESRLTDGRTNTVVYAGCETSMPGRFTGCYARCVDGALFRSGTFEAHRMTWQDGETESSGGLQRVSETFVELGTPVDIYVAKDHAYVVSVPFSRAARPGGLTVFDVKDRRNPVLKKVISLPEDNYWNGVWAKGNALYVASDSSGVIVFDISNPSDPAFLRTVPSNSAGLNVHTVLVDGDRLYGMSPGPARDTLVFDVSDPLAPVLRQRIAFPAGEFSDGPHDAFAYNGRLYINHTTEGLHVVDVGNLDDVKLLGTYPYANSYSHHNAVGTFAGRTIVFEGGENPGARLRVLDATDPAKIVKIGEYTQRPVTSIHNMLLVGTRLYVAWYHEGVRVLDVSNPTKPTEVAHYNTFRETDPNRTDGTYEGAIGIRVPGDGYVYVVDTSRGLLIFNQL
ncbi:hypothetical protein HPC49_29935 [Pyxidicoccus fallax]|uniref:Lipoprotein n=1 Tax=Pyxidicoccus fallax TaxID=394095 RepID=A0A848LTL3_9BACT|nr:hypothetical protein [Pyxidicoccus fallax]NMO21328.1 hypothetical protein [Pyxidicoccus fallax]NPC82429.1 hypothetical protein [Pyxidicoccus fallax]